MPKLKNRTKWEIAGILLVKLALIMTIKQIWFTDRPPVSAQATADKLLGPTDSTATQRK